MKRMLSCIRHLPSAMCPCSCAGEPALLRDDAFLISFDASIDETGKTVAIKALPVTTAE